jgi:hypothetical protein
VSAQRIYVKIFQHKTKVKFYLHKKISVMNLEIIPLLSQSKVFLQKLIVAQMIKNKRGFH